MCFLQFPFCFFWLTPVIRIVPETPMFNYATNVWAPFLKAGLLNTTDCVPVKDKTLYSLHNSDLTNIHSDSFNRSKQVLQFQFSKKVMF